MLKLLKERNGLDHVSYLSANEEQHKQRCEFEFCKKETYVKKPKLKQQ